MSAVDLDDATTELYGLTPADFTARRTELTAKARDEGRKDLAKEISELRRPTVSAWLLNQLARGAGGAAGEVAELEALGEDLREAQAQLDGPKMKELARRRHALVAALVRRADTVAAEEGQKLSAGARRELEETLGAAVADEQASLAVTSGRLTRALVYAGFGEVDVTAATATPVRTKQRHLESAPRSDVPKEVSGPGRGAAGTGDGTADDQDDQDGVAGDPKGRAGDRASDPKGQAGDPKGQSGDPKGQSGDRASDTLDEKAGQEGDRADAAQEAAAARARAALAAAGEAAAIAHEDETAAADELEAAARRRDDLRAKETELDATLDELQREIVRVRHELDDLTRSIAAADREYSRRERQLEQARKAGRHAQKALDDLA